MSRLKVTLGLEVTSRQDLYHRRFPTRQVIGKRSCRRNRGLHDRPGPWITCNQRLLSLPGFSQPLAATGRGLEGE